jgi:hypothetical protein
MKWRGRGIEPPTPLVPKSQPKLGVATYKTQPWRFNRGMPTNSGSTGSPSIQWVSCTRLSGNTKPREAPRLCSGLNRANCTLFCSGGRTPPEGGISSGKVCQENLFFTGRNHEASSKRSDGVLVFVIDLEEWQKPAHAQGLHDNPWQMRQLHVASRSFAGLQDLYE